MTKFAEANGDGNDRAEPDIVSLPQQLFCSFDGAAFLIRALGLPVQVSKDWGVS
jgi:hypothetical protein